MANTSDASGASGSDESSQISAMRSSPSAGGMRMAGNYAQRGSPGVVRRAASRPISIIRSTSVPTQLQDRSQQQAVPSAGGSSSGSIGGDTTTSRRVLHLRDRSLQNDININGGIGINRPSATGAGRGFIGVAQSLPIPQAPMLAGSLPPSRFLDDLPPLTLGPQADVESFRRVYGAVSASQRENHLYASSCPATLGGCLDRPPGSGMKMSVLEEGSYNEEDGDTALSRESKSATALSILELLSKGAVTEPEPAAKLEAVEGPPEDEKTAEDDDTEAVETSEESDGEQEDLFKLEGLEGVNEEMNALSLSRVDRQQG